MYNRNHVHLIGHLGANPEVRLVGEDKVANIRLATTERWKKDGKPQERTEWHRVSVWGKAADFVEKYLHKGSFVSVEGKLRTNSYDKDGTTVYSTEIRADAINSLEPKPSREPGDDSEDGE